MCRNKNPRNEVMQILLLEYFMLCYLSHYLYSVYSQWPLSLPASFYLVVLISSGPFSCSQTAFASVVLECKLILNQDVSLTRRSYPSLQQCSNTSSSGPSTALPSCCGRDHRGQLHHFSSLSIFGAGSLFKVTFTTQPPISFLPLTHEVTSDNVETTIKLHKCLQAELESYPN